MTTTLPQGFSSISSSSSSSSTVIPSHINTSNLNSLGDGSGFVLDIPSPGSSGGGGGGGGLRSPTVGIKSQRTPSFSRDGILGSAQKTRNMSSQSSGSDTILGGGITTTNNNGGNSNSANNSNSKSAIVGSVDVKINGNAMMANDPSDDGINPLKRRNTETGGGVDYPRRRATIAVGQLHHLF